MIELPLLLAAFLALIAWPEGEGRGSHPGFELKAEPRGGVAR